MSRSPSTTQPTEEPGRSRTSPTVLVVALVAVGGLLWFLQGEANDLELGRELRALPGGDAWMTESSSWVEEGKRGDGRAIWAGKVDELVRTNPEAGQPELLALKMVEVRRVAGSVDRKMAKLYVTARGFDFAGRGLDEPLSGQRWLVATYENEHGQRYLHAAMAAPQENSPKGEVPN